MRKLEEHLRFKGDKASTTREVQSRPRKAKRHNTKDPKVVEAYMQLDK